MMKKDKDFSTGILYEDSFEDRPLDDTGESSEHSTGILKKFLSMKRWKKIVLCVVTALVVVVAGLAGSFFYLRAQGEKNLKTEVVKTGKAKGEREGLFVTYNDKEYQYNEDIINFLCLGIDKDVPFSTATEEAFLENLNHALENIWLSQNRFSVQKEVAVSQVFRENVTLL